MVVIVTQRMPSEFLAAGEEVEDVFSYTVSDGTLNSSAEIRITITGVNDVPVAIGDIDTVAENSEITSVIDKSLLSNDEDIDGDVLSVTAIRAGTLNEDGVSGVIGVALEGAYGALTLNANGSYNYVANKADSLAAGTVVEDIFSYTVSDGAATSIAELRISVSGVNDAPVAVSNIASVFENSEIAVDAGESLLLNDADIDNDTLSVVAVHAGTLNNVGTTGAVGTGLVGDYGTLTLNTDGSYSYAADASATEALAADTVVEDIFTYTVSDGALTSSAELRITVTGVNDAPVAASNIDAVLENGEIALAIDKSLLLDAGDIDGDALTVSAVRAGALSGTGTSGTIGAALTGTYGTLTLNANGSYSYAATASAVEALAADAVVEDIFTYTVSDGALTSSAELRITVTGVNDAPVAASNIDAVLENGEIALAIDKSLLLDAGDIDGDALTVSAVRAGALSGTGTSGTIGAALTGTYGTLTLNADGSYSYAATASAVEALAADAVVEDVFTYTVSDGALTSSAELRITVTGVNDAPVAASNIDAVLENGEIALAIDKSLLLDAGDIDGDALTVSAVRAGALSGTGTSGTIGAALTGTYGTLTLNANGSYSYAATASAVEALAADAVVEDVFTYTVSDGALTSSAELRITVTGVNDAPVAASNIDAVLENGEIALAIDKSLLLDAGDIDGDALTVSAVRAGALSGTGTSGTIGAALTGTYGTLTLNADGSYSYAATASAVEALAADAVVEDVFTYTVSDGALTSSAELRITVTGVNDAPVAASNIDAVLENGEIALAIDKSLLLDAGDIDGDALTVSAVRAGALSGTGTSGTIGAALTGTYGTLTLNADGSYSYAATASAVEALAADAVVEDIFTYTVSDGALTSSAELRITVTGVNDAPVAASNIDAVLENGEIALAIDKSLLLDAGDIDGDALTVSAVRAGALSGTGTSGTIGAALTGTYGTLTLNADGSYSYAATASAVEALAADAVVEDIFTYTVSDGALTSSAELRITVTGVNDAPVAVADHINGVQDESIFAINVLANDKSLLLDAGDIDGDALTVSAVRAGALSGTGTSGTIGAALTGTYGTLTLNADGSYSYAATASAVEALAADAVVEDIFTYTVSDGALTSSAELRITVTGVNDAPVAASNIDAVLENGEIALAIDKSLLLDAGDIDGDALTVSAVRAGALSGTGTSGTIGAALTGTYGTLTLNADGSYSYAATASAVEALAADAVVEDIFTYTVSDGALTSSAELRITVTGVNDAPVAASNIDAVLENGEIALAIDKSLLLDAGDIDGDALTVSAVRAGALSGTGTSGTIGAALTGTYGTLTLNADGSYSYAATASAVEALAADAVVEDIFTYTVSDGALTSSAELRITVTGVNDAPVAASNIDAVLENGEIALAIDKSLLLDAGDIDGDALTVSAVRAGALSGTGTSGTIGAALTGTYGTLTLNADGSYSYAATASAVEALAADAVVEDIFTYTVSDGALTSSAELRITVTGVNDAPVAASNIDAVLENGEIALAIDKSLLLDAGDIDGDALTVSAVRAGALSGTGTSGTIGAALTGTYGTLTLNADGSYSYAATASAVEALAADAVVEDIFTYTVSDGALTSSAELRITVTGVNDAPVAASNIDAVLENGEIALAIDKSLLLDAGDIDGDALTVSAVRAGALSGTGTSGTIGAALTGTYGTLTLNADGSYSYAATASAVEALAADAVVEDIFTYTVSDGALTSSAELRITVTGVNDAPVAASNIDAVLENGEIALAIDKSLLLDAGDIDGDALTVSAVRAGALSGTGTSGTIGAALTGTYGTLTLNADGSYSYAATASAVEALAADAVVEDIFTYTVSDGALTSSAELRITVTGVNDAPVAASNIDAVLENGEIALAIDKSLLLDAGDIDGDALTVSAVRAGALSGTGTSGTIGAALTGTYGTLTLNADGSYSYAATASAVEALAADAVVEDIFTYTVSDGALTSSAELRITVTGVNDAPVAASNIDAVLENGEIALAIDKSLLLDAGDIDGDALTVSAVRAGALSGTGTSGTIGAALTGTYGTLTLNADGSYSYAATASAVEALAADAVVEDIFTYTVSDGALTSSAELRITVTGVNDAPVAASNIDAVLENGEIALAIDKSLLLDAGDIDGDALTVSAVRAGALSGTGTSGTIGAALTGTYGTLTLNADGSYSYAATASAVEALAADAVVEDIFTYTVSDGALTSSAELRITVTGVNDRADCRRQY